MRRSTLAAFGLLVVSEALAVAAAVVNVDRMGLGEVIRGLMTQSAFPVVGAIVAWKQPRNPIGWVFLGGTIVTWAGALLSSLVASDPEAASPWAEYVSTLLFLTGLGLMSVLFLVLFPDGRPPSPRWRVVPAFGVLGVVLTAAWTMVRTCSVVSLIGEGSGGIACDAEPSPGFARFDNPLGWSYPGGEAVWGVVGGIGGFLVVAALLLGVVSLVVRYRRSGPVGRAQLRWPLGVLGIAIPVFVLNVVFDLAFSLDNETASLLVFVLLLVGLPVAIGVAITRYRLFEIDQIIRRTLVYSVVVVVLGAVYGALVVLPSTLAIGTGTAPTWMVAGSTLVVFALFSPLRRRVQRVVERRFNRARHDAMQVVEVFAGRVQDMTHLAEIASGVEVVLAEAMEPASLAVWLRPPDRNDPVTAS